MERNYNTISEDFLTCPICKDDFTDPRALPCLHAFCKTCVSDHINQVTKGQRAPKGFDCPVCKRYVDAPDPHQAPGTWAERLPSSHLINSLMDNVRLRNDVSKCDPCFRRKDKVIASKWCKECAEALCEQCVAFHKSLKYSHNHNLLEFEELRQQPIKNTLPRPPCPQHENTTLGFFCEDHQKVCCSSCVTVDHRKCSHVTTSVDAASKYRNEVDTLTEKLRHQNGWSARIMENRQHSMKLLDDAEAQLKSQIISIRQQFDELLRTQEKQMLDDLKAIKTKERHKYEKEVAKCEEMICTTGNALNIVKNSMQHGTDSDILMSVNSVKKEAKNCDRSLSELSKTLTDILLIFTPDRMLSQVLGSLKEMGKISFSHSHVHVQPPYNLNVNSSIDSEPETERFTPDTPIHEKEKSLTQRRHLEERKLIDDTPRSSRMSQQSKTSSRRSRHSPMLNTSRSMTNSKQDSRQSSRQNSVSKFLDDSPRSKASRNSDIFHATIDAIEGETTPRSNSRILSPMTPMGRGSDRRISGNPAALEFFFKAPHWVRENAKKVTGQRGPPIFRQTDFLPTFTISTGAKCWGLDFNASYKRFAVCCYTQPPCIKIFSRSDGREIKSLARDRTGVELFFFPDYVAMDSAGRHLFVTDKYKKSVIGLTMEGEKRWECSYSGLKNPRGICVVGNRIYVAGCRSHSVVLLSTDGEIIGDVIVEGISFPNKICLSPHNDRLLVTQFQGTLIDIERNTVKIYRLD
ncbi:transcription intermediary factor 1-alpha-like [Ruditapes philippinarum]|uniref:transcription intermediary factor 1-alpha-like n=1 Tax=Ruditapes philippinarum TaxID=129788 RepID=UPI00295B52D8|nr:transcription intermediary factor 1-alpha-like [Ruditapes philippinarum]